MRSARLQGALLHVTAPRGAFAPKAAGAYLIEPPFDHSEVDWNELEKLAEAIPETDQMVSGNTFARRTFLSRVKAARARPYEEAERALHHDPAPIYREVLPALCASTETGESRLAAIRGLRRNYHAVGEGLQDRAEYRSTLTAIDRTLCILPACAELKDDIEGLDCRPFAERKPQTESKPVHPKR